MAQISGSVLIVVMGASILPTLSWGCVPEISAAVNGCRTPCSVWFSLRALTWPPLVWWEWCRVVVGILGSPRWRALYLWRQGSVSVMESPCQVHANIHNHNTQFNVWNLVLRCWLWDYSPWELRCVLFKTRSLFTVSLSASTSLLCSPFLTDTPYAATPSQWKHASCLGWRDCGRWVP